MPAHRGGVYYAFRPVYLVSKVLGVMPLKYALRDGASRQSGNALRPSKAHGAYTLFWLLLAVFQTAFIPYYMLTTGSKGMKGYEYNSTLNDSTSQNIPPAKDTEDSWQSRVILVINPIITSAMGVQCRLTSLFRLPKILPRILTKLDQVDRLLNTSSKLHRSYHRYLLRMFVAYSFVASLSLCYYLQAFISSRNTVVALGMVCLQISNLVSFCTELQFSALCYFALMRFKQINRELKKWRKTPLTLNFDEFSMYRPLKGEKIFKPRTIHAPNSERMFINVREAERKPKENPLTKLVNYFHGQLRKLAPFYANKVHGPPLCRGNPGVARRHASLAEMVSVVRRSHALLHEVVHDTNALYRGQLLVSMSGCFGNGLLNIYFTIFGYNSPNPVGNALQNLYASKLHQALGSFALCSYFGGRFVVMTMMASKTIDKAQRSVVHVSALNDRHVPVDANEELQMFFQHAQSGRPSFSACGYFTLEMNLITSALAAWCTYLVIMAQFHASP